MREPKVIFQCMLCTAWNNLIYSLFSGGKIFEPEHNNIFRSSSVGLYISISASTATFLDTLKPVLATSPLSTARAYR